MRQTKPCVDCLLGHRQGKDKTPKLNPTHFVRKSCSKYVQDWQVRMGGHSGACMDQSLNLKFVSAFQELRSPIKFVGFHPNSVNEPRPLTVSCSPSTSFFPLIMLSFPKGSSCVLFWCPMPPESLSVLQRSGHTRVKSVCTGSRFSKNSPLLFSVCFSNQQEGNCMQALWRFPCELKLITQALAGEQS